MSKPVSWIMASINIPTMIVNLYDALEVKGKYEPYWSLFFFCFGLTAFFVTGMIPRILRWRLKK